MNKKKKKKTNKNMKILRNETMKRLMYLTTKGFKVALIFLLVFISSSFAFIFLQFIQLCSFYFMCFVLFLFILWYIIAFPLYVFQFELCKGMQTHCFQTTIHMLCYCSSSLLLLLMMMMMVMLIENSLQRQNPLPEC